MIELKNIKKGYNGELVLKGLSFKIESGEFVSIMGRSGSGKSTLLSIIGGFLSQDEGDCFWDGENIKEFSDDKMSWMRCNKVGFVFQNFKLISTLNIMDNIMLPSSLSQKSKEEINNNFNYYVNELGLDDLLKKYPNELSGGQQQRVAIARALTFNPEILILDEPTGALDKENETKVMELITKVNKENRMTIVQVTHSEKVASYATKILNMSDGVLQ